jgi:hypothetical protein
MDKPSIDKPSSTGTQETPSASGGTSLSPTVIPRTYAWWLVLGLVGLDCFSTLGYLPTLAVEGAKDLAPLGAAAVGLLILFVALPIYLYVVGRSPNGRGATGLLESHLHGWGGKLFILLLLGFVATDFVMTRSLSTAAASRHLLANPYAQSGVKWLLDRKDDIQDALPPALQGEWTDRLFDWWDEQLIVTVVLMIFGFALYFFVLRGFTRGFVYFAAAIVAAFLVLNALVIGSSLVYLARHPQYLQNWTELISFGTSKDSPLDLILNYVELAIKSLPALALGLSGFELSMTVAPLVSGKAGDDPTHPRGRIRNMRKLLIATALLMGVLVPTSVACVKFLVPPAMMEEGRPARHRALAYLAHGGVLQPPGKRFGTDKPSEEGILLEEDILKEQKREKDEQNRGNNERNGKKDEVEELPPPRDIEQPPVKENIEQPPEREIIDQPPEESAPRLEPSKLTAAALNRWFGHPAFSTIYDVSAVLILFLAGASVTIGLRDLLPQYLTRYGMEMHWARRIGLLLHLFNAIVLIVVLAFHASVSQQQGAYSTSVLVLLAGATLAALVDLNTRLRRYFFRPLLTAPLVFACLIFLLMAVGVCYDNLTGLLIALLFVIVLLITAGISRWIRSTELRYYGFAFADEESGIRWEQIRSLEFQVLVPHRPDDRTLAEKEAEIRARHRLGPDVPIIFIEAELGDPSDFQHHPLMQIVKEDGREIIRVSQCASIAHVLAAIALEFREVGRPPEMHFAWSGESPLASNLNFLLWGQGNVPWLVHALIRKAEPDPQRQPRVVIG